jgi:16S rRNA (uracil1498-N3)-methyltransferase
VNLFYTPDISFNSYTLNEEESKHCVRVLRMGEGDELHLVDGKGGYYIAEITDAHPKKCEVHIKEKRSDFGKRNHHLHIACAPTKNIERFEWFLEKATEIGIDEITPMDCERSERTVVKHERLEKVLIAAMKQSVKAYLPRLNGLVSFPELAGADFAGQKFIAHCGAGAKELLKHVYAPGSAALILIGPEGDFTESEIKFARERGFLEISLGSSRLRTETAALAACHTVELLNT